MRKKIKLMTMVLTVCLCAISVVFAADGTWSAAANGNWSDSGNWSSGTIADGSGSTAYFTDSVRYNVSVDSARTIGNITSQGTRHDLNSVGILTLAGSPTISQQDIVGEEVAGLAIWNPLDGTEGFTKTGAGILALVHSSGTLPISGTINVTEGILKSYDSLEGHMPNITSVVVSSGAQLRLENANPFCNNPLTLSGIGVATHAGNNCGALLVRIANQTTTISNIIVATADTRIGGYCGGDLNKYNLVGEISGPGQPNFYAGGGATSHKWTFELLASNSYAGGAILSADSGSASTLKLHNPNALSHTKLQVNASWNYGAPATLDLNGYTNTVPQFEMNGTQKEVVTDTSASGNGLLIVDGGGENNMLWQGDFYLYGGEVRHLDTYCTIRAGTATTITGGVLYCNLETMLARAAAGDCSMTVRDSGLLTTWILRFNDWGNATVNLITGGVIRTAQVYCLKESGAGPYAQTFNFNGGTLSDAGWAARSFFIRNDEIDYIVQAGGANIEIDGNSGTNGIDDSLQHDAGLGGTADGGLTKSGAGVLALTTNNTYTGPTVVEAGTLLVNGNGDISASSSLTVQNGAAVGGNGVVGAITVPSGGVISPGNSIGTLNTGNIDMEAGSAIDWEVGNPGSADLVDVTGTFTIPAGKMTVNAIKAGSAGGTYTIVQTTGGIVGNASDVTMSYGSGITGDANPTINGNNLEVNIVPEPAILGLLSLIALAFLRRK